MVIYRRLLDFDESTGSPRSWIYGICLRIASQYRRRVYGSEKVSDPRAHYESVVAEQEYALDRKRAREWLYLALRELDKDDRSVFIMYELDEVPMKDVAALFDWPLQTTYSRLHRARRQVEDAFRILAKTPGARH